MTTGMTVEPGGLERDDVRALLAEHLAEMHATSPACSVHALDLTGLQDPAVTFWTVREDGVLLGCGALKQLSPGHGEVKSMRTTPAARGRGVAALVLAEVLAEARRRGYERVSLETGSQAHFAPARRLYARHGFVACGPFEGYQEDPSSTFLTLDLRTGGGRGST